MSLVVGKIQIETSVAYSTPLPATVHYCDAYKIVGDVMELWYENFDTIEKLMSPHLYTDEELYAKSYEIQMSDIVDYFDV